MELPRGMKDFTGSETGNIEHIRSHFKHLSNLYGFSFMDPSPIELLSTLETKSGPAIKDEIYYFKDKGDREIALRFDFTMGLTRYATSQKSMKLPAKISSFGGVFRYDEPQKGRYRYFHQWDLEIYGKANLESESEIIELTSRLFDSLLLKNITIDVNHRNLVESYINKIFDSKDPQLVGDMLRAVDKIAKKSKDEIIKEFEDRYSKENLEKILEFSQIKGSIKEVESVFDVSQLESWDEIKALFESLENRGVSNVRINFGIVRIPTVKVPTIIIVATTTTASAPSIDTVPANAIDSNDAIKITAITSSTINIPKTRIEDSFLIFPVSSKTFTIIAVLLIDNAAARNNESMNPNPNIVHA